MQGDFLMEQSLPCIVSGVKYATHTFLHQLLPQTSYLFERPFLCICFLWSFYLFITLIAVTVSGSSAFVFVTERMTVTHYLKCTVSLLFVGTLSLTATHCHLLSLVAIRCYSLSHDISVVCLFIKDHSVL